ncbi:SDR family oxidoreductase [Acanthopleuribacter pedis]|uniref:SDR family oxidoreductase n=1 Tax=Acanthopleuribacter pedis TaxID=442870 RepID=A0A8J7U2Y2_9BACT|nr:SDR family oxidoreductase [Acanthopleuribacter pedis]MBO1319052.1 SDR family oxidoreductase [Acanthopleuribacter pedis]
MGFTKPIDVLVMGSARGLGRAFVQQCLAASEVTRVWALGRSVESGIDGCDLSTGKRLRCLNADLTDDSSLAAVAAVLKAEGAQLDVVVNFAALLHTEDGMVPERKLADVDPDWVMRGFQVNALGPLLLAKHLHPFFPKRTRCLWVSLSARVGSIGDNRLGGWYTYRGTKAALNMFTRNLSIELGRRYRGLICIAYHPGTCATDLSAPFRGNVPPKKLFSPEQGAGYLCQVLSGLDDGDNGGFFAWDGQPVAW